MTNTIELLESIGGDASLRHASASDLGKMLQDMQASDELKRAASTGDAQPLKSELDPKSMSVNQNVPQTGLGDEDDENDERDGDGDGDDDDRRETRD